MKVQHLKNMNTQSLGNGWMDGKPEEKGYQVIR